MLALPSNAPGWLKVAYGELGVHEVGDNAGPDVERYIRGAGCGQVGDPWCAIFANYCLETSGVPGTRSASSQSFRLLTNLFDHLDAPAIGAIAVYWRGDSPASGIGHVGFYMGERGGYVWTLGGNESDAVEIAAYPKISGHFGLRGYYWPHSVLTPQLAPVFVAADVPRVILTKVT